MGATQLAVRVAPELLDALDRFIEDKHPGISRPHALRLLARAQLQSIGMLVNENEIKE